MGGTWIQPDTNLAGAFTLRRQFETGLEYFESRFGVRILRDGKPWLRGVGLQALLFRDTAGSWGTNAPRQYDENVPPVAWRVERAEVIEDGPLCTALWVHFAGECSWLELTFRLFTGRDAIDVDARLLWNERAALLKLSLPCGADPQPLQSQNNGR